jgi:hypothetical protein
VRNVDHVTAEHLDPPGLDLPRSGNDAEQCRLADPIRADQADKAA